MDSSKKVYFITFGCKVNQAETEGYKKKLSTAGYSIASSLDQADIIIINSCRVTRKAESRNEKSLKALARRFPTKKLILTGCDNQRKFPSGIVVLKREDLLKYLLEANKNGIQDDRKDLISKTRGLVKVQDGCNNFCSYCIVPYSRGREVSYNPEEIIKEIKKLEKSGFKEIVLVGINVGKFMHDKCSLAGLLTKILSQTTIPRVRLSSIHPEDINKDLIKLFKNKKLCNHLHLSIQSGSDSILKAMNRQYTQSQTLDLIKKVRREVPEITLTTDLIVGFPGESETDFKETVKLIKKTNFLKVHLFRFSKREGTKAAKMPGQIPEKIKKERFDFALDAAQKVRKKILKTMIGREVTVLFEERKRGITAGFTENYLRVRVEDQANLKNQILPVVIKNIEEDGLLGELKTPV